MADLQRMRRSKAPIITIITRAKKDKIWIVSMTQFYKPFHFSKIYLNGG